MPSTSASRPMKLVRRRGTTDAVRRVPNAWSVTVTAHSVTLSRPGHRPNRWIEHSERGTNLLRHPMWENKWHSTCHHFMATHLPRRDGF